MFRNQSLNNFVKDLASEKPTPGGGSAAAVVGALAAGLVEMVANLTIKKKNYQQVQKEIAAIKKEIHPIKAELLKLADADALAFKAVMNAYQKKDADQIQKSLKKATEIPFTTALLSTKVKRLAQQILLIGNKNARSDALSAKHLANAAYLSALENVKINKELITDQTWKNNLDKKLKRLSV